MFAANYVPKDEKQIVIEYLTELKNRKYPTGICHTVMKAIKSFGGLYNPDWAMFRNELPELLAEHPYVDPEAGPYWIMSSGFEKMEAYYSRESYNESAYDVFYTFVDYDGSSLEDLEEIPDELVEEIKGFADRRRSVIELLIKKLEET